MIHSFKLNGYNIVLDVASGSVHSVDEVAYDVINDYESKSRDQIGRCYKIRARRRERARRKRVLGRR